MKFKNQLINYLKKKYQLMLNIYFFIFSQYYINTLLFIVFLYFDNILYHIDSNYMSDGYKIK